MSNANNNKTELMVNLGVRYINLSEAMEKLALDFKKQFPKEYHNIGMSWNFEGIGLKFIIDYNKKELK